MEIIHNASLYHDDIFDDANTRRDEQTAHLWFGLHKTILVPVVLASLSGLKIQ